MQCKVDFFSLSFLLVRVNGRDFPLVVIRFPSSGLRYSICSYICVCADCRVFFVFFFSAVDEGEVGWEFFRMFNKFIHVGIFLMYSIIAALWWWCFVCVCECVWGGGGGRGAQQLWSLGGLF